jgi:glycosyltransferase involved in cell wall biosynthesis
VANKLRILHIIESLGIGGAEKSLVQIVTGLSNYHHVVAILHSPDTLSNKLENIEIINLNSVSAWQKFRSIKKIRRIVKEKKIDLVHAQLFYSTLIGRVACQKSHPFIFTLQSMLGEDLLKKNRVARFLERKSYARENYVIAVSAAALNDYKKYVDVNDERVMIISNPIEAKFFGSSYKNLTPGKKIKLVAVGNLKPLKNFDYILDSLKNVPAENFELDIFGEGTLRKHLERRIQDEGLPVKLRGNVSDLHLHLRDYDIYLHCSKYEGASLAIFEAMATGLPLIVSDIPVLHENTGGYASFVNLNDPMQLTKVLIALQQGNIDVNGIGRKGFEWVKTIAHPDVVLHQIANFYDHIEK